MPGARFCGQCGSRFDGALEQPAGSPTTGGEPVIERRLVSLLFADLVGFTARSETQDPEQVREFLTAYFDAASQIIDRYGGAVEKFIGDAVMAVWGTPATHEDDAERAVRAALDLVDAVQALKTPGGDVSAEPIQLRAAVMSGQAAVTVGAVGQGMVAGDLVNTCSRLQSAAVPGTVLVDETTERAAAGAIAFEPVGEQALRGKSLPVAAWRALRVVAERGGIGRAEGLEPPFTGREEELRLLKEQLHATGREGRARLVSIIGQGGMGKSRLMWELRKYIDGVAEDIYWHEGRSPAYGEGVAFWALGEMVRLRAGIAESEDDASAADKLHATIREFVSDESDRRWISAPLGTLLGLEEIPTREREVLFAAWRTFFEHVATRGPTVMVFEDLHWADQGLLDFIDHLLEWSRTKAILVIALARPELLDRRSNWGAGRRASVLLQLEPLRNDAIGGLLRGLAPGLPGPVVEQVVRRAEGVPLYAVETVRMLLDEGRLVREGGTYRLTDTAAPIAVPATLQALIASRLDALDPIERTLVQDASVLGKSFTVDVLATLSGHPVDAVRAHLLTLVRKDVLTLEADPRSPERGRYAFVQDVIREVAYGTLAKRGRRSRHLAAARYFEMLGDQELSGVLATHYLEAWRATPEGPEGDAIAAQSRVALRAAIDRALSLHANAAALDHIEQALIVTSDPSERAALWSTAAEPAEAAHGSSAGQRYLRQALEWYEANGDMAHANDVAVRLCGALLLSSEVQAARAVIEPVIQRIDAARDGRLAARAYNQLARSYLFVGDGRRAVEAVEQGVIIAERNGLDLETADLFITKSWAIDAVGRPREAVALARAGMDLADRLDHMPGRIRSRMNLSNLLMVTEPAQGHAVSRAGIELAVRIGHADWAASLAGNLGAASLLTGDWDETIKIAEELDSDHLTTFARASLTSNAVVIRAFRGEVDEGVLDTDLARSLADSDAVQDRAFGHVLRAFVMSGLGQPTETIMAARRAVSEAPEIGETLIALGYMGRAGIHLRDASVVAESIDSMVSISPSSGWTRTCVGELRAGALALAGDTTGAVQGFLEAIERYRALGLPPEVAIASLEALELLGDALSEREAMVAEAAAMIDRLRFETLRPRLEAVRGATVEAVMATG
ncbi:MAG: AAA family ATPase [Chloroflexota bacterium]|nr:AAA family ATPase [Chloroflexota bacterium]